VSKTRLTNPQPINVTLPTRGYLWFPRPPSPPSMCGADSSAAHVYLFLPHKDSPPAVSPEDRYPVCDWIWQYALGGRSGVKPCAWPAGMRTECSAGSLNCNILSKVQTFVNTGHAFRLSNYVCHRTERLITGGGTAILVRRGIVHLSVPIPGLYHSEVTVIKVILAGKPVKNLAAYLSPSRPSSFQHPSDRPDLRGTAWANFQNQLENQIPFNPELHDEMSIDTCVENFSGAVLFLAILAAFKCQPRVDPTPQRVEERSVECDTWVPRSRRRIAVKNDKTCDGSSYTFFSLITPGGIALSNPEKAEALYDYNTFWTTQTLQATLTSHAKIPKYRAKPCPYCY